MYNQRVEIALSFCPNDVFILSGLILEKIKSTLSLEFLFADIERLNNWALEARFPVIKTSFALYPHLATHYEILGCGTAMGFGVGPILVSLEEDLELSSKKVALPGKFTTANFLMELFFSQSYERVYLPYQEIIPSLLAKKVDFGVLIHEGRFVYQRYGLNLLADLGILWESKTGLPLPLGGFLIRRDLTRELKDEVLKLFRESLKYSQDHREEVYPLLKKYAQELDWDIIFKHVNTFVNDYTYRLKDEALAGLRVFFSHLGFQFNTEEHLWESENGVS